MKKLTLLFATVMLVFSISISSCKESAKDQSASADSCCTVTVTSDSLIALWNDAWNTKNAEALKNMIAEDAVVLETDWQVAGRDSIMAKWITPSLPVISNLKTEKVTDCICCCCVSLTAFYSLDVTTKEGVVSEKGNFTFIWNQDDDKTWKLKLIHMDVFENKK